ncbi:hypothetical protein EON64_05585 [archaeon]|nr:MAG: hypothetical protein EON64_05585 [archaeon]
MRLVLLLVAIISAVAVTVPPRDAYPQILSHRGACGYVPEHSLQAYQLAIDLKTDYVEPDLCLSKDGYVYVICHVVLTLVLSCVFFSVGYLWRCTICSWTAPLTLHLTQSSLTARLPRV